LCSKGVSIQYQFYKKIEATYQLGLQSIGCPASYAGHVKYMTELGFGLQQPGKGVLINNYVLITI
jgi:hypothetical protein